MNLYKDDLREKLAARNLAAQLRDPRPRKCPHCGTGNYELSQVCLYCGQSLKKEA